MGPHLGSENRTRLTEQGAILVRRPTAKAWVELAPTFDEATALPKLDPPTLAPTLRNGDCTGVVCRFELMDELDVAGAIIEIEPIMHAPRPRGE